MTGYSESTGVTQPLSRMTIASMADMGYAVSYAAADPFSLSASSLAPGTTEAKAGHDVVLRGPLKVIPGGARR